MNSPPYFIGLVLGGVFSLMGYFVFLGQLDLLNSGRGGMDGLDDFIGFFASGGFWLGCGATAWHCLFKWLGVLLKKIS